MPADEDRPLGLAAEREPLVPGRVDRLLGARLARRDRAAIRVRVSHVSVHATRCAPVLVARELAELLELGDGASGVERHATSLIGSRVASVVRNARHGGRSRDEDRGSGGSGRLERAAAIVLVPIVLVAVWEGYKALWQARGLGLAVPGQRHDDAAPLRRAPRLLGADDHRRSAAHPLAARRRAVHDEGGDRRVPARRRHRLRARGRARARALPRARAAPVRRRLADGADPRDRADGRDRARLEGRRRAGSRSRSSPRTSRSSR